MRISVMRCIAFPVHFLATYLFSDAFVFKYLIDYRKTERHKIFLTFLGVCSGSGERCKLPQRGLGQSPSRNRIWCILALISDIWCIYDTSDIPMKSFTDYSTCSQQTDNLNWDNYSAHVYAISINIRKFSKALRLYRVSEIGGCGSKSSRTFKI